jgi:signal recognition particle GTPase
MIIVEEEAHVAREEPRGKRIETAKDVPELVIFVGLQASGKSTFFRERFATTHELVSKDLLGNNKNRNRRQAQLIEVALRAGSSESWTTRTPPWRIAGP